MAIGGDLGGVLAAATLAACSAPGAGEAQPSRPADHAAAPDKASLRPLNQQELTALVVGRRLRPARVPQGPEAEVFEVGGVYQLYVHRASHEGVYRIQDAQLCVDLPSAPEASACRRAFVDPQGTFFIEFKRAGRRFLLKVESATPL